MKNIFKVLALSSFFLLVSCDAHSKIKDALDLVSSPSRKEIDTSRMGVNAFVNDARFGSIRNQFREVRDTLKLNHVRVLFNWDDNVQPTPNSPLNFSFYDDIVSALPSGVDAMVVLTAVPSWMSNPSNWIDGNPRRTFVEMWVKPVTERYAANAGIIAWQIWNEPNMLVNPDNQLLDIAQNPQNYVEMLALAHNIAKQAAPGKLVLNAATTAINQNYPDSKNYNRVMRESGAEQFVDVWAIHYYGRQYENVIRSRGIRDFASELIRPIWVTESGAQGPNSQLGYAEEVWPFLRDEIPSIDRIYHYQFTDSAPLEQNYGLRTLDPSFPVSDLYIHLRDR
jgi:hypothetical protein